MVLFKYRTFSPSRYYATEVSTLFLVTPQKYYQRPYVVNDVSVSANVVDNPSKSLLYVSYSTDKTLCFVDGALLI